MSKKKQSDPVNPQLLHQMFNQAVALFQQGKLGDADTLCRRIEKKVPDLPDILHFRGLIACRMGKPKQGVSLLRKAVKAVPENVEYRVNLGTACQEIGANDEAIRHFQKALKLNPDLPELRNSLGLLHKGKKELKEAEEEFREAVRLQPDFAQAYFNLGNVLLETDMRGEAEIQFEQAIKCDPDFVDAYVALAWICKETKRAQRAEPIYREILRVRPEDYMVLFEYSEVLLDLGKSDEALEVAKKALPTVPDEHLGRAYSVMADALRQAGQHDAATEYYRKTLSIHPDRVGAYNGLVNLRKFQSGDPVIAEMEQALQRADLEKKSIHVLHFALGKVYNDCKQYDDAFKHYLEGNRIRGELEPYDSQEHRQKIDGLMDFFNDSLFESPPFSGLDSDLPIFIVGMPRSGTTLTEQIISSHPKVFGAGELGDIKRVQEHLLRHAEGEQIFPQALANVPSNVVQATTEKLLQNLTALAPDADHIIDKMPHNFMNLGLIAYLLPKARVIHCQRSPLDNCISIFFQNFNIGQGHAYRNDLRELGRYHRHYQRLMAHWRQVLPNPIFEVQYEQLVAEQESVSRQLIEFCGLEWDDACLQFHKTERPVNTASHWQVRQPIYTGSVERWRRYERWLQPLQEGLEWKSEGAS